MSPWLSNSAAVGSLDSPSEPEARDPAVSPARQHLPSVQVSGRAASLLRHLNPEANRPLTCGFSQPPPRIPRISPVSPCRGLVASAVTSPAADDRGDRRVRASIARDPSGPIPVMTIDLTVPPRTIDHVAVAFFISVDTAREYTYRHDFPAPTAFCARNLWAREDVFGWFVQLPRATVV